MADNLTVSIDADGQIRIRNSRLLRWLAQRAGLYQVVPTAENLLVFHRQDAKQPKRGGRLVLTGSIEAMGSTIDAITFVSTSKRSGALVVLDEGIKKTLFFTDGDVRMSTSNVRDDRLGALLYRFGMVTEEQIDHALSQQSGKRRLGKVLIDDGVITAHDLYTIIRKQVEEIFYSVLLIRKGVFYFYELPEDTQLPQQIHLDTQNLLLEGVRRIDEMSFFRERIPHKNIVLEIRPDITPKKLGERESLVYNLVDGRMTLDEVARESRLGEFETTKVIFNMMQLGYVQRRRDTNITRLPVEEGAGEPMEGWAALIETYNSVFRKIFVEVRTKGKEPALREGLDSFFEGATGFVELFRGAHLAEDGALPAQVLLGNLERIQVENKMDFLYNGLNEFLFFEMFTAGEALPPEDEERLQEKLAAIFQEFSR